MVEYNKAIGNFRILADEEPKSKGYSTPEGVSLSYDDLYKEDVFYEQDYFEIFYLKNHRVINSDNITVTPIIESIDVLNKGYVCTWHSKFWIQGYAVINNEVYFVEMGNEEMFYLRKPKIYRLPSNLKPGEKVNWENFKSSLSEIVDMTDLVDLNINSWVDNAIVEYMLLP